MKSARKMRVLLTSSSKLPPWTSVVSVYDERQVNELKELTRSFLNFVSGGEPSKILEACLSEQDKKQLLSAGTGRKRLEKLNDVVRRCQPLKPWTARNMGEVKARLDVELTARRTLSFLSGDMMPLLDDILYPNEKDLLAEKYRLALDSIGTVVRNMQPKQKGKILNSMRQAGFSQEDLKEMGWVFSSNLWNTTAYKSDFRNALRLEPVQEKSGDSDNLGSQGKKVARDKTAVIRRRNISTVTKRTNEESVEIENANNFELLKNKMFLNTFLNRPQDQDLSSSSEEETEDYRNPMFPSL